MAEFSAFQFDDLSDVAREFFVDRSCGHSFSLRGANYLSDKKKDPPSSAVCKLMLLEMYEVEDAGVDRHDHIASRGMAKTRVEEIAAVPGNPFQIVINFQIPGDPPISVVTYFAVPPEFMADTNPENDAFKRLLRQFIDMPTNEEARLAAWTFDAEGRKVDTPNSELFELGSDNGSSRSSTPTPSPFSSWMKMPQDITWPDGSEPGTLPAHDFRNLRFKLIPAITEGPWVVKAAVRSQPVLLGQKVVQRYFRGEGYLEIDIHVGSSVIASQIIGVCRGYTKNCTADVGIVIQGEDPSELPERLLGCVSFNHLDMAQRRRLDPDRS